MKPVLQFSFLALALACVHPCGASIVATYNSAASVPVTAGSYSATGTFSATLNFAPPTGTNLTVVKNTGLGFISGKFTNLAQGQLVTMTYGGIPYRFVANYYGGTGNDLVLLWANTRLVAWGKGLLGQVGDGFTMDWATPVSVFETGVLASKTMIAAATGDDHTLALSADGAVFAWGGNPAGQLGIGGQYFFNPQPSAVNTSGVLAGKTVVAIAGGRFHSLALCSDGTIAQWGTGNSMPVAVSLNGALSGKAVVAIAAGAGHSLALCSDGTVVAWGSNSSGQLGNNSTTTSTEPVAVTTSGALAGKTVIALAAGAGHNMALCSDGTVAGWGYNISGQLGNGTTTDSLVPVTVNVGGVLAGKTVVAISAGAGHTLALCSDSTLAAWGENSLGQLGVTGIVTSALPVAVNMSGVLAGKTILDVQAGLQHSVARTAEGQLAVWGLNTYAPGISTQIATPSTLGGGQQDGEKYTAAFSGSSAEHNLAIVASGPGPIVSTRFAFATSITNDSATLRGAVNAAGADTTVMFEYGLDTSYGTTVALTPATGSSYVALSAGVTGLTPGTTYHYRVKATNSAGTRTGIDVTFTTKNDFTSPTGGSMTLNPELQVGAGALLYVGFSNWADANHPLSFAVLMDDVEVVARGSSQGASFAGPTTAGTHTLKGRIYDALGNFAEVTRDFNVVLSREEWRNHYFGTTENAGDAADSADPDGDGLSNHFEYVASLAPNDPLSRFDVRVEAVAGQPGRKAIIFGPSIPGRAFSVEHKSAVGDAAWQSLSNFTTSEGISETKVTDLSAAEGGRIYRVRITRLAP